MAVQHKCLNCGVDFISDRRRSRFHSLSCSNSYRYKLKEQRIEFAISRLTVKQQKLVSGIVSGKSQTQALIDAGYNVSSRANARALASKEMKSPVVKEALTVLLQENDLELSRLLELIGQGLSATRTISIPLLPTLTKAKEKTESRGTTKSRIVEVPDWPTRLKFIETALALHGLPDKSKKRTEEEEPYVVRIRRFWARIEADQTSKT